MAFEEHIDGNRAARLAQAGPRGGAAARGAHTKGSGTDPLGVEPGFTVRREYYDTLASRAASRDPNPANRGPRTFTVATGPTYFAGAETEEFATKDPVYIRGVQKSLEKAGLLDNYRGGFWDSASQKAMKEVMSYANQRGISWEQATAELIASPLSGPGARKAPTFKNVHVRRGFVPTPYSPPDYDKLKVTARSAIEDMMGRPLLEHEVVLLANEMLGDYRRKHDAAMDAARRGHSAQQRELEEFSRATARLGQTVGKPTETVVGHAHDQAQEVAAEQVDPESEMVEFALRHWADKFREVREAPANAHAGQLMQGILGALDSFISGK